VSSRVQLKEHLSIKVGRFILSQEGMDIASGDGVATKIDSQSRAYSFGVLCGDSEVKPRRLFGLFARKPRRLFLGVIWFGESSYDGVSESHWIFDVFGRDGVELARQLAEEMASKFDVDITVNLVREEPHLEAFVSDHACCPCDGL